MKNTLKIIQLQNKSGVIFVSVVLLVMLISITAIFVSIMSRAQVNRFFFIQQHLIQYPLLPIAQAYALKLIDQDSETPFWGEFDYAGAIGVSLDSNKDDVYTWSLEGVHIEYGWRRDNGDFVPGFTDEDSKLNLNAINAGNREIISNFLDYMGFSQTEVEEIVSSIVDWMDTDLLSLHEIERLETDYYQRQQPPYFPMNKPFSALEEFRYVRGVDKNIYSILKPFLTVFPKEPKELRINFLTVSVPVLYALIKSLPAVSEADASFMAEDFVRLRELYFADVVIPDAINLNNIISIGHWSARHQLLLQSTFQKYGRLKSNIIRIPIILKGIENNVPMRVFYLYDREDQKILEQGTY